MAESVATMRHTRSAFTNRRYVFADSWATAAAHVDDVRALRVNAVVQSEFEGGIEMVRRALSHNERDDDEIERVAENLRRAVCEPGPA